MKSLRILHLASGLLIVPLMLSAVPTAAGGSGSVDRNVVFGTYSGSALLMDVYKPTTPNGYGIVVINGSAWYRPLGYDAPMLKDSAELMSVVQRLSAAGYTAFVINHRAAPRFHVQNIIEDAQPAVRFVRGNAKAYGIRADRIGAVGASSGGHLVSMLGTMDGNGDTDAADPIDRESSKIQAAVTFYAPVDLRGEADTPANAATITSLRCITLGRLVLR